MEKKVRICVQDQQQSSSRVSFIAKPAFKYWNLIFITLVERMIPSLNKCFPYKNHYQVEGI